MPPSIFSNALIASVGRIVNVILGLIVTALITRFLGPATFGSYILVLSFATIIQLLADFGLYLTLTKEYAAAPQATLVSHVVSLRLVLLAAAFGIGAAIAYFTPSLNMFVAAFGIAAVGFAAQSISQLFMGLYQHHQLVWRATLGDLVGRAVQVVLVVAIGATAATINNMAAAFTAGAITAYLVHQLLLPSIKWRPTINRAAWKRLLAVSWPLGLMLLLNAIFFRVDIIILSLFRSAAEVGYYGLAYRVIESTLFIPAMLGGLLLPRLSEALTRHSRQKVAGYLTEALRVMGALGALLVAALITSGSGILSLIAGSGFAPAVPLLSVLSLAGATMFIGNIFGFTLVAMNKQRALLVLYSGLVAANLLANLIFVPLYGATAAAWTTVATELASTMIAGAIVMRAIKIRLPANTILLNLGFIATACVISVTLPPTPYEVLRLAIVAVLFAIANLIAGTFSRRALPTLRAAAARS